MAEAEAELSTAEGKEDEAWRREMELVTENVLVDADDVSNETFVRAHHFLFVYNTYHCAHCLNEYYIRSLVRAAPRGRPVQTDRV